MVISGKNTRSRKDGRRKIGSSNKKTSKCLLYRVNHQHVLTVVLLELSIQQVIDMRFYSRVHHRAYVPVKNSSCEEGRDCCSLKKYRHELDMKYSIRTCVHGWYMKCTCTTMHAYAGVGSWR
jgi:hypothetical protein